MPAWTRPRPVTVPPELVEAVEHPLLAELLHRRGLGADFLTGGIDVDAPGLPDLAAGVGEVLEAVLTGRRICVYGDYDTDGVTATTLLVDLLRSLGAHVTYFIPNRFRDGYGMNPKAVEALAAEGVELLLTCDCGIKNVAEVALARKLGLRVVVTDHHELGPELPVAEAVINPKRLPEDHPCRMLPGVGTAYLLARQVLRGLDRDPAEADRWLELVAIGVVADVVPLNGANRELARRGLTHLHTTPMPGLQALLTAAGLEGRLTEEDVAFQLVPRLNAAGRLGDAGLGVRLLLAADAAEARELAAQLDQLNLERKRLTSSVVESAMAEADRKAAAILLYRPEWHEGVLGIAAGKLAEEHGVPALLMARKHGSNLLVGSARAPEGYVLHEALEACAEHLVKYGGHAGAAGFSLLEDNFAAFRAAMLEEMRRLTPGRPAESVRSADLAVPLAVVDMDLYEGLRRAAPFGEGNPAPVLFAAGVKVLSSRPVGPNEKHLRLVLRDGDRSFVGLWWGAGSMVLEQREADLFYRLNLNRWNGEEVLQVMVEHLGTAADLPEAVAPVAALPDLIDRRGVDLPAVLNEFPDAVCFHEGPQPGIDRHLVDRYGLQSAPCLLFLAPLPSPRLLDELLARSGARQVVLAWPVQPGPEEERFLPVLLRLLREALQRSQYVSIPQLAVRTGELEVAVRLGIGALAASHLIAVDEEEGDILRLRRRTDGKGIVESPALLRMRKILAESRAYRRFLRQASVAAIRQAIYPK